MIDRIKPVRFYVALVLLIPWLCWCSYPKQDKSNYFGFTIARQVRQDAGYIHAVNVLTASLESRGYSLAADKNPVNATEGSRIVIENPRPEMGEAYSIVSVCDTSGIVVKITGGERGVMYGIFKLAEEVRLGKEIGDINLTMSPDFSRRIFAEQGQLFDLPSVGYHLFKPPWVNNKRFEKEKAELEKLVDQVASMGFNTFCLLHVNFEDYINYKYLEKQVYDPEDVHRAKSRLFAQHLNELIDYAHSRHIEVYLQVYEFQYPPHLSDLYEIDLEGASMEQIIHAKVRELFEVTRLDGLIVTATESLPRSGYQSNELWRKYGKEGAGKMMAMYDDAARKMGKTVIFRSWMVAYGAEDSDKVLAKTPADAQFEIKHTGNDFWLNYPLTDAIRSGIGNKRPLTITFDVFPQYYGWSRLICYQKRISEEARIAKENGVSGIQAWGAWAPGCIWSDGHPGYRPDGGLQNTNHPFYDMAGPWNNFRIFTRGFTPGQMNAYQLARIAWDVKLTAAEIARDWGILHFGNDNADAVASILMSSQDAFRELYPHGEWNYPILPVHLMWATTAMVDNFWMNEVYQQSDLKDIQQSNSLAYSYLQQMEKAFARIDPLKVPDTKVYNKFREGLGKTKLFLSLYLEFREFWMRERDLKKNPSILKVQDMLERDFCKSKLDKIIKEWQEYPEEAEFWGINKNVFEGRKDYTLSPREVLKEFNTTN